MAGNAGFNVTGQGLSGDNVLGYLLNDFQAQTATVINETKIAAALVGRMPYPIFRFKGSNDWNDDGIYSRVDPTSYVNDLIDKAGAPPGCWLYGGNEFGSSNLAAQDIWTNQFVEQCARRGYKPAVHAQAVLNPVNGVTGWRQLMSSVRAAEQADGAIIPHIYWRDDPASERKRPAPNAFSVLDDLRSVFGGGLRIICSEIGFDANLSGTGYVGLLGDQQYAEQLIQVAQILMEYNAYGQFYGFFPSGSQWSNFNLWFNETIKPLIAAWNKGATMTPSYPDGSDPAQKMVNVAAGLNLRQAPGGPLIRTMLNREVVTIYRQPRETANSHVWLRVTDSKNNNGWAADDQGASGGTSFSAPPAVETNVVTVTGVPYFSEFSWQTDYTALCGETTLYMMLQYDRQLKQVEFPPEITPLSIAQYLHKGPKDFTSLPELVRAGLAYGLNTRYLDSSSVIGHEIDTLLEQVTQQKPVGVLLDYGMLPQRSDQNFTADHILLVVGVSDQSVYCNDPDNAKGVSGQYIHYPRQDFLAAWSAAGTSCFIPI